MICDLLKWRLTRGVMHLFMGFSTKIKTITTCAAR
jgi:hypothetical protein